MGTSHGSPMWSPLHVGSYVVPSVRELLWENPMELLYAGALYVGAVCVGSLLDPFYVWPSI